MRNLKRYTLPMVLGALALVMLTVGILATTIWSPRQEVTASRDTTLPFTTTRAGVLRLYEPHQEVAEVRVEAKAPGDQVVWMALGSPEDVAAWVQAEDSDEIVGLSDLETLKAVPHEASGESAQSGEVAEPETDATQEEAQSGDEAPLVNPLASDMWTAVKYGRGSATMTLTGDELDQSLLAATDGVGAAPTLTLSWQTPQQNMLAVVGYALAAVLGALAVATGLILFASRSKTPRIARAGASAKRGAQGSGWAATQFASEVAANTPSAIAEREQAEREAEEARLAEEARQAEFAAAAEAAAVEERRAAEAQDADEPIQFEEVVTDFHEGAATEQLEMEMVEEGPVEESRDETVTTESGMMNLAALQHGLGMPTRRALRDAEERGIQNLIVGGRKFSTRTGEVPVVDPDASEEGEDR